MTIKEIKDRLYTVDDLLALPDDGKRYELIEGELIEMPTPNYGHALLSAELLIALGSFVKAHDLGYVTGSDGGYLLHTSPDTLRVPDVAFIPKAQGGADRTTVYKGAPALAVEVISPSETVSMILKKLRLYFTYGVQCVWLVYPEAKSIEIYTNLNDDPTQLEIDAILDGSPVLPGFTFKLSDLFAVLDA